MSQRFTLAACAGLLIIALGSGQRLAHAVDAAPPQAPAGFVIVDNTIWYQLADEPNQHFHLARLHLLRREPHSAAKEIRIGAAIMKLAAGHAAPAGKKALEQSTFELGFLASELENNKSVAVAGLDAAFARAHFALAEFNQQAAQEHFQAGDNHHAGHHLRWAAHDIEYGRAWAGEKVAKTEPAHLIAAEKIAERLIAGAELSGEAVLEQIAQLNHVLKLLQDLLKVAR